MSPSEICDYLTTHKRAAMRTPSRLLICLLLFFSLLRPAMAQDNKATNAQHSAMTITASASAGRVRFTADSSGVQIRLEVYDSMGRRMFDNEVRGGNVLDWHLEDGQAQRLVDDTYLCVITVKSLSGKITQEVGSVIIKNASVSLRQADPAEITAAQAQAVGPVEENASLTIVKEDEARTTTVIAHNGDDGLITRGKGALSFRMGDFFSGKDTEQMRLTAEGNLGIGVINPRVRLDVDGVIRASQGIIFPDGTVQYSAASKTLGARSAWEDQILGPKHKFHTDAAGAGTQGRIAKWTDDVGTLGDSVITETAAGFLGIGTPSPDSLLNIQGTIPSLLGHMSVIRTTGSNNGFGLLMDATGTGNNNLGFAVSGAPKASFAWDNTRSFLGFVNLTYSSNDYSLRINSNGSLTFHDGVTSVERLRVTSAGSVGIGVTTPPHRLSVFGGPSWTSDNWGGAIGLPNASAIGWQANASGFRYGIGHTTNGFAIFHTASDLGTASSGPVYEFRIDNSGNVGIGSIGLGTGLTSKMEIFAQDGLRISGAQPFLTLRDTNAGNKSAFVQGVNGDAVLLTNSRAAMTLRDVTGDIAIQGGVDIQGNVTQNRDKFGSVKAMVYVNDGKILRCYNGLSGVSLQNGTTPDGCGFHVDHPDLGIYFVDFGFQIADRFYSLSQRAEDLSDGSNTFIINLGSNFFPTSTNVLRISTFYNDDRETKTNGRFMLIVY